jgi:hypothetical protein
MSIGRIAKLVSMVAFLVGCTVPNLESAHFDEPALLRSEIAQFYTQHAREEGGRCTRPYIDAITKVDVLEDMPERWVAEIRYRYLDRLRDEDPGSDRKICFGFASRTFILVPVDGILVVTEMSGTDCPVSLFSLNKALGLELRARTCP